MAAQSFHYPALMEFPEPAAIPEPHDFLPPGVSEDDWAGRPPATPPPRVLSRLTNSDVSMFSDIAGYIDTGVDEHGRKVVVDLTCMICGDRQLEMPSTVSTAVDSGDAADRLEPLVVLPCSHMFGAHCIAQWFGVKTAGGGVPDCPACRLPLVYGDCGHHVRLRPYDPRFARSGQLPLTLPEGGGVPTYCAYCYTEDFEYCLQYVAREMFPVLPAGAFLGGADAGLMFARVRRDYVRRSQSLYKWSTSSYESW